MAKHAQNSFTREENEMWYVIQVRSRQEDQVLNEIKAVTKDYDAEIFLPKYETKRKFNGQWKRMEQILFPGYLFLITDKVQPVYENLRKIPSLTKVLKTGDEFVPLNIEEIEFLKTFGKEDHVVRMSEGFIENENIIITTGPMKDWTGPIKKINRHKREAVIEVPFFGRVVEVKVGLEIVRKI